ncbi:hypothetical protein ACRE_014590 [Hapsidospora chrysogenum ATCC 11550]|uniref:Zn(2)-C6 fungal-type domain-containing protein n=1 Tax=Hapsidospora chrysogenum (strain ATCC 11550 / CBS 779.69 / DSM 880 / IAM 14645 / JCM 23072 / IMI 49137) TaxID=857340 RepID=A0A086TE61_HAPC1|nr:hypothetical protein ACRE_014590 [Hapsidospora chrysogenum ATCC 11550]
MHIGFHAATAADLAVHRGRRVAANLYLNLLPDIYGRRPGQRTTDPWEAKQRRIKCDEKRPACSQCVRSHKDCTGYPPPSRHAVPYVELRIAPKPAPVTASPLGAVAAPRGPSPLARETILPPRRANRRQQYHHQLRETALVNSPFSLASTPPPHSPSPTLYQPSANIGLRGVEIQYFDLFRAHTSSELSGYFDSVFWTQRVLQECHIEPAIRHAAVALGALYKTLEQSFKSPSPSESPQRSSGSGVSPSRSDLVKSHWQVAVRQYSDACNAMMLLDGQTQHSNRTRLMASVLLSSFDAFIGDHRQAINQIQNGLGLLETLRAEQDRTGSREPIDEELMTIFARLAIQAKSYDMAFHFPEPYVIRLNPKNPSQETQSAYPDWEPYPERQTIFPSAPYPEHPFSTLREARLAYDMLIERILRFIERLHLIKKQPYTLFPESWRQYAHGMYEEMDAWARSFQPLFEARLSPSNDLSPRERSGIATLKMSQVNSWVLLRCIFNSTESYFDAFIPQFRTIVDLGHEIVAHDERRAAAIRCPRPDLCPHRSWDDPPDVTSGGFAAYHIKPSFSADLGIVPPLFVVATKCREPYLRRRAIQLLRSSARREGMWDSELAARIGEWIMELEESDTDGGSSYEGTPPPVPIHFGQSGEPLHGDAAYGAFGDVGGGGGFPVHMAAPPSKPIPEEKRVMVHGVDFDLRTRFADLQVGTRGLSPGSPEIDRRHRTTHISW